MLLNDGLNGNLDNLVFPFGNVDHCQRAATGDVCESGRQMREWMPSVGMNLRALENHAGPHSVGFGDSSPGHTG